MNIDIDGKIIKKMDDLHELIIEKLDIDRSDYGYNLDALWDVLSSRSDDIEINLLDAASLSMGLGKDYDKLVSIFMNLSLENGNIDINIDVK